MIFRKFKSYQKLFCYAYAYYIIITKLFDINMIIVLENNLENLDTK